MRRTLHSMAALFVAGCSASPGAAPDHPPPPASASAHPPPLASASAALAPVASATLVRDASLLPPEVKAFVHDHARALRSIDPGGPRDDLAWLRDAAARARVIGLGEQSHGTHEHARLKQRLIEMLVRDAGYTALAIEAPMLEIADLDEDVTTGGGDLERDAVSLGFWSSKIDEMLEVLAWIRAYNAEPTTRRKVRIYGCDMQKTPRATTVLLRYLERVDPARAKRLRPVLAILANPFAMADYAPRWMKDIDAITAATAEIRAFLDSHHEALARKTDERAWSIAALAARILAQFVESERADAPDDARDRSMADNLRWVLENEGPDGKIMLWAHNGHVSTAGREGAATLGSALRRALGDRYLPVGLFFDQGSFRAFSVPRAPGDHSRVFEVGAAPAGSFEDALRAAGSGAFGLSLLDLPATGPARSWFEEERPMRVLGWPYWPDQPERAFNKLPPRQAFEVVFFTGQGTPTHSIERLEEDAFAGPEAWSLFGSAFGYTLSTNGPPSGFVTASASGPPRPEAFGGGRRRVSALPWRGATLQVRFSAKVDATAKDGAWVWVRANQGTPYRTQDVAYADARVTGATLRNYVVSIEVPSGADTLDFGLALVGDGRATLQGAALEKAAHGP